MDAALDLTGFAYAIGRAQAAWRFAGIELRRASALAIVSAAWDTFRRDAGAGDVGPAHERSALEAAVLTNEDPRRDGVLLWLADYGAPAIAEAAALLVRAAGATRRFGLEAQALLDTAGSALAAPPSINRPIARELKRLDADNPAVEGLAAIASVIDQLRSDAAFLEGEGEETRFQLPGRAISHYVPPVPGAAWALNMALLARPPWSVAAMPIPSLISRQLFRSLEPEEIALSLVQGAAAATEACYSLFERMERELARGHAVLSGRSRNSHSRDAWRLVLAVGTVSRAQLARAFGLSRAGADIQAHVLAAAGLVTLGTGGSIKWSPPSSAVTIPDCPPTGRASTTVFADFDTTMAEVDQLLAKSASAR